jgi:hypothetical protein
MENQIKDFIGTEVKACLQNKTIQQLDLNSSENQSIIENIFQLAYSILE